METFNVAHHSMKVTRLHSLFLIALFLDPMTDSMTPCLLPLFVIEKHYSDFYRNQWKFLSWKFLVKTFITIFVAGFGSAVIPRVGLESFSWKEIAILKRYNNSASKNNFILGWDSSVSMKTPKMSSLTVVIAQVAFKINGALVNTISKVLGITLLVQKHIWNRVDQLQHHIVYGDHFGSSMHIYL